MPRLKKRRRTNTVPTFIEKLASMLQDEKIQQIVSWDQNGDKFLIKNITDFVTDVLPTYYKHNNLSSFIRQLNMHNFHKVKDEDKPKQSNEQSYHHPKFLKDHPALMKQIKRKSQKKQDNELYLDNEIKHQMDKLKKRQDSLFKRYEEIIKKSQELEEINQKLEDQIKKINNNGLQTSKIRNKQKTGIKQQQYLANQFIDYSHFKDIQNKNFGIDSFMDVDQELNPKQTFDILKDRYSDE